MWVPNEKRLYKVSAVSKSWYTFLFLATIINRLSYPFFYFCLSHSLYHSHLSLCHKAIFPEYTFPVLFFLCFPFFILFWYIYFFIWTFLYSPIHRVVLRVRENYPTPYDSEPFFHRIIFGNITASKNMKNSNSRKDICQKPQIIYSGMIIYIYKKKKIKDVFSISYFF